MVQRHCQAAVDQQNQQDGQRKPKKNLLRHYLTTLLLPCCGSSSDQAKSVSANNRDIKKCDHKDSHSLKSYDELEEDDISVVSLGEHTTLSTSIPSVPDDLALVAPNKTQLPPLFQRVSMAKNENSAGAPSGFQPKRYSMSKQQQIQESKMIKKLAKKEAEKKRDRVKKELANKKKGGKEELKKVECSKKRARLEEALQSKWNKTDNLSEEKVAEIRAERSSAMVKTLEREVELLKEQQECKKMETELLRKRGHKGILFETVSQCKSLKIKYKHSSLGKKIKRICNEVNSLKEEMGQVAPVVNTHEIVPVSNISPHVDSMGTNTHTDNSTLLALFVGESFRAQTERQRGENKYLAKFQESCEKSELVGSTCVRTEQFTSTSAEDQTLHEGASIYSFNFEEDVDEDEDEASSEDDLKATAAPEEPSLYRCERLVALYKLLPRVLETIEEETEEDLKECENGMYACTFKFYPSCVEGGQHDFAYEDFYM